MPSATMRSPLWPILLLFVALHALYNWAIPLGEGPDEPGHMAYVLFLANAGRLPVQRPAPAPSDVPGEGHQPPLAYALTLPAVTWLAPAERVIRLTANPRFIWAGGDEPGAFRRGSRELWPWDGLTLAWHLARAVAGLWGGMTVACTYLAARRLAPRDKWLPVSAALLVVCNPQALFTTALVSNDALLAALGAALLWHCLERPARPWRWALFAGALFGLALLTKQSALCLGPLLLWGAWRAARGDLRRFVALSLLWVLATLTVAGWWFWRNWSLYGDGFGLGAFVSAFATQPFAWRDPAAWTGALRQLFDSFWARFGWMNVRPPSWMLWVYASVCALALVGWALACSRTSPHPPAPAPKAGEGEPDSPWIAPALALMMALAWTVAFAATAGLVAWQGRMLFPALAASGVLLACGLRALGHVGGNGPHVFYHEGHEGHEGRTAACGGLCPTSTVAQAATASQGAGRDRFLRLIPLAPLLALAVSMPFGVIRPAYTWVALAPHAAQAVLGNGAYGRFAATRAEYGVILRGWRLDGPVRPGADLPLTLTWNSLAPVPQPWTIFVHLVDGNERIVAQSNLQPQGNTLPFPLWTAGDWVADSLRLALPAALPPGVYRLRVGLYRADQDGQRQRVWAEDGRALGDYVTLGGVRVEVTP